jgi:hypothetical protein
LIVEVWYVAAQVVDYVAAISGMGRANVERELAASWNRWDTNRDKSVDYR